MTRHIKDTTYVRKLLIICMGIFLWSLGMTTYAADCQLLAGRSPNTLQNGNSLTWYKSNNATYTQTCEQLRWTITCNNGIVTNGNTYTYQNCTNHTRNNCSSPISATHLTNRTLYKASQATYTQSCAQLGKTFQCLNGSFSGQWVQSYPYGSCVDSTWASCINIWTNTYLNHWSPLVAYTQSNWSSCTSFKKTLTCINGTWSWGNQSQLFPSCSQTNNWGCVLPSGTALANGQNIYLYSNILWSITWLDYSHGCAPFSGKVSCINGTLNGNTSFFKYTLNQCQSWTPKSCSLPGFPVFADNTSQYWYSSLLWETTGQSYTNCSPFSGKLTCINGTINGNPSFFKYTLNQCQSTYTPRGCSLTWFAPFSNTQVQIGFLATGALYPKTCNDVRAALKCVNGNINGNRQTYMYSTCTPLGQLTQGKNISLEGTLSTQTGLLSQWSSPLLALMIRNKWNQIVNTGAPAGMVTCFWSEKGVSIYSSPAIPSLVINPWSKIAFNIKLNAIFTQSLGVKTVTCTIVPPASITSTNNTWSGGFEVVTSSRFDIAMEQSLGSLRSNLEAPEAIAGAAGVKNFIFDRLIGIVLPLVVAIGILLALLGFYKIMFSSDDKAVGEGTNFIIYGVIGIILIVSAKYIGTSLVSILTPGGGDIQWWQVAQDLYDKIAFPFIKFAMYLVLGAMFIILLSRVISFLFGSDTDAKKKAGTLIGWNLISMFVIIGAKQIIEAVYGKVDTVQSVSNLGEIWTGILANKNIPLIYHIINRVLGLTSLILLILIIVQTLQLLLKPSDEKQMTSVKNSLLYMGVWIFVIWTGYLIVNFLVIN